MWELEWEVGLDLVVLTTPSSRQPSVFLAWSIHLPQVFLSLQSVTLVSMETVFQAPDMFTLISFAEWFDPGTHIKAEPFSDSSLKSNLVS